MFIKHCEARTGKNHKFNYLDFKNNETYYKLQRIWVQGKFLRYKCIYNASQGIQHCYKNLETREKNNVYFSTLKMFKLFKLLGNKGIIHDKQRTFLLSLVGQSQFRY